MADHALDAHDRRDEDAVHEKRGRPIRDYAYVLSSNQNFDAVDLLDVVLDGKGLVAIAVMLAMSFLPDPLISLAYLPAGYATWRFGLRWWAVAPFRREDGQRHVMVIYQASGYWHVAEFVRGKGEIVKVLTYGGEAMGANVADHVFQAAIKADWDDLSTDESPRCVIRAVKTYRRRPATFMPVTAYPKTSVGFAAHVLGIHDPSVRTPKDLMDYCERAKVQEHAAGNLQAA